MLSLKVINMWAGPGAGKSTMAAGLFNLMKHKGHKVELVSEVAKRFTYENNTLALGNQLYILGQQDHTLRRLEGQVEWVITDSPLPIGLAYASEEYAEWLPDAAWSAFDRYQNFNVWVDRAGRKYQTYGRNQTEAEAMVLDNVLSNLYAEAIEDEPDFGIEVKSNHGAPYLVYDWAMKLDAEFEAAA